MFLALLGFLEYRGRILINGIDISTIPRPKLRSLIVSIPQDPVCLAGSIRHNLMPGNWPTQTINDSSIIALLRQVNLWHCIEAKGGLDVDLSAAGMSAGQMQLLCLCRSVFKHRASGANLVLMDEATSSMDADTDATVQGIVRDVFATCTVLMIAHREDTIEELESNVNCRVVNGEVLVSRGDASAPSANSQ